MPQLDDTLSGFGIEWLESLETGVERVLASYPDPWRMLVRDGG